MLCKCILIISNQLFLRERFVSWYEMFFSSRFVKVYRDPPNLLNHWESIAGWFVHEVNLTRKKLLLGPGRFFYCVCVVFAQKKC